MNRRQFLQSASALTLAAHEGLALSAPKNVAQRYTAPAAASAAHGEAVDEDEEVLS
jgi:hypothetical protein